MMETQLASGCIISHWYHWYLRLEECRSPREDDDKETKVSNGKHLHQMGLLSGSVTSDVAAPPCTEIAAVIPEMTQDTFQSRLVS